MSQGNFTIYKSSAGSGKTFTLVKEYLALALADPNDTPTAYRNILAVTFTNKAAAEMKERIIKALRELAEDDYSNISGGTKTLLSILQEQGRQSGNAMADEKVIRQRASRILTSILHNYSDFAIGTIDAFVHKVVRTFAYDLKIPMSFEIEMDDEKLLTQAIDLLLSRVGKDEKLTKALVDFTESKTDDEKSWHIENDLLAFAKNLLNEEGAIHIGRLRELTLDDFFEIRSSLHKEISSFEEKIRSFGNTGLDLIRSAGITNDLFAGGENGIGKYFTYLAQARIDNIIPSETVKKNVAADKWYAGKAEAPDKAAIDSIKGRLAQLFDESCEYVEQRLPEYRLFALINRNIYSLAVLNEIEKLMNEYKQENNIIHISEFNKMIAKIVLNEPIPFIYERLGEKYNNYLIDEFQDTSVLQFQNLLPLIDNSLANGHFTMLVGDGKQAIYRWRGGEVEQFAQLPKVFGHNDNPLVLEREAALIRNHEPKVLNRNFRSKREIIEFNNAFFRSLSSSLNERYRGIYDDLEQQFNPENTGGFVQVEFLAKDEFREMNMQRTFEIILQLQADNFALSDISILVRRNSDGSDIANFLTGQGIPVISSDSLLLSRSAEVNFIHAILRYLANDTDYILQTEIIEYLISRNYLSDKVLANVLQGRKEDLAALIATASPEFDILRLSKLALYELCEEILRIFRLNATPDPYVQFFLDEVLSYSIKKNNNLQDFNAHWSDRREKASLVVPQGMNAVSIMTIHRSKGLEFPVVILPFSNTKITNGKSDLWIEPENETIGKLRSALVPANKQLQQTAFAYLYEDEKSKSLLDNLNVLYVAMTRAEKRMYILTGQPAKKVLPFSSVSDMFAHYYQQQGSWSQNDAVYTFGTAVPDSFSAHGTSASSFLLSSFNSTRWRDSIRMRAAAPGIWNTQMAEQKKDYGVMVHSALARIRTAADMDTALSRMLAEGLITREEQQSLREALSQVLEHPELREHFRSGLKVKNEAEILLSDASMFRPDRVVIDGRKAVVIDYKTGRELKKHQEQISEYARHLADMGYEVTDRLIVYLGSMKVVKA